MKVNIAFELQGLPPLLLNCRMNRWKLNRLKKDWYARVYWKVRSLRPPVPCHTAKILIVRKSSVEPDHDNEVSGGKWLLDGLQKAGVIQSDKRSCIGRPDYSWSQAKPGKGSIFCSVQGEFEPKPEDAA